MHADVAEVRMKVRAAAAHVLREAIELNVAEEAKLSRERDREERQERRDLKRAVRRDVALRHARALSSRQSGGQREQPGP
jgi:hypothetical protein